MSIKLTATQIQEYIDNDGEHCPYCESEHGIDNFNNDKHCMNPKCKKEWTDEVKITGISEY